ncbi:MAG: hypothetical protein Q7T55_18135 [Solirubrobacteraceae bacterium]|nr:hypothetical protein [Solirubrobacteraceae bacterium]
MKKLLVLPAVVIALGGAAAAAAVLTAGPTHEETAASVKTACKGLETVQGSVIGASLTTNLGADAADLSEAIAETNPTIVTAVSEKLSSVGTDANRDDRDGIRKMTDSLGRVADALESGDFEGAYVNGDSFSKVGESSFGVECPNPGGNAESVKEAALAPLNAACNKWRDLLSKTGGQLSDLSEVSDAAGARVIEQLGSRAQGFAREVRSAGVEGSEDMVDALQSASREATSSASSWRSGYYADADISGLADGLFEALDEGENLGAVSCARG